MSDRDKSILEEPEKMCEYCCNFDKEHIGMDCMALCKLTMTLAYAEDYGGNCMFYNVPKEQIIVPPCKVGETVYSFCDVFGGILPYVVQDFKVGFMGKDRPNYWYWEATSHAMETDELLDEIDFDVDDIGKTVFLTKEEAEQAITVAKKVTYTSR